MVMSNVLHYNPDTLENYYDALTAEAKASRKLAMLQDLQARGIGVSQNSLDMAQDMVTRCRKATDATFKRLSPPDQQTVAQRFRTILD